LFLITEQCIRIHYIIFINANFEAHLQPMAKAKTAGDRLQDEYRLFGPLTQTTMLTNLAFLKIALCENKLL
jgi:hypothetical protein